MLVQPSKGIGGGGGALKIGISGHQKREGIDWAWVAHSISHELVRLAPVTTAFSSLAAGSDQVFAKCVLEAGIPLVAVIPISNYERFFDDVNLAKYNSLLKSSKPIYLDDRESPEASFFAAGRYIVENSDLMIAVWDEKPAAGLGGTADVVDFARTAGKDIVIINPLSRIIIN